VFIGAPQAGTFTVVEVLVVDDCRVVDELLVIPQVPAGTISAGLGGASNGHE